MSLEKPKLPSRAWLYVTAVEAGYLSPPDDPPDWALWDKAGTVVEARRRGWPLRRYLGAKLVSTLGQLQSGGGSR